MLNRATEPGIDSTSPRLSWRLQSDARGVAQAAYRIQVAADEAKWGRRSVLWDTGKVASDRSTQVPYEGQTLESGRRYYWRVRVWDGNDRRSKWSAPAYWEMGLLEDPYDNIGRLQAELFRAVRKKEHFTSPERKAIHKAIRLRNDLVHRFMVDKVEQLFSDTGR